VLYPEWATLLRFPDAAAPISTTTRRSWRASNGSNAPTSTTSIRFKELLYGLYVLISVHFQKEEDLQLPAFDAALPAITEAVLKRMQTATGHAHEHGH
jgi:hypothetical protein